MTPPVANSSAECLSVVEAPKTSRISSSMKQVIGLLKRPLFILLALTALVVPRGISKGEFFYHTDEMSHAMNGVFVRDFLADLPVQHPVRYAYEYYAKYPAVALPHWPPLFYAFEGILFLFFGLSPWVSRLTVLGFAMLAVYFWYRTVERVSPPYQAFVSGVVLVCVPYILRYERLTMLEIPALAVCLGAIYFWLKFLDTDRRQYMWTLAAFSVAGFLMSQAAVFLVFFIFIHLIVERRFRLLKRWDVWLALLISAGIVLPWYLLTQRTERALGTVATRVIGHNLRYFTESRNYTYYPVHLYEQLGPVVLSFACIGLVLALLKPSRANRLMLVWAFAGYICFTLVSEKDPRHTIVWIPPLVYLGLMALETLSIRRRWAIITSSAAALFFLVNAIRTDRPLVSGPGDAAQYVLSLPESEIVYYQGFLSGDFIFFVRKLDPEKRHMVAREKQVVVGHLGAEPRQVLHSAEEVLNFFQTWGIRYAIVEDRDPYFGFAPVRQLLNSGQFELVRTFPILTNQEDVPVHEIRIFRYRGELRRTNQPVTIPMMTIRHNIPADLSELVGRPWPNQSITGN
jgi:membrane protein implicated in regulation of membrane protease activity